MTSHRRTLAAALATAAASVSLYPIFTGGVWFLAGAGGIAVVAAAGTATRWRRLPESVCLAGGLVALLLYLNLVFAHSKSLLLVVPTPASARLLGHLVNQGFVEAGKYAPPVPELTPMVLLAAGGIGIAALLTDWMAVRLGSAALAGLPLLLLFTEPFTLSVGRGFLGTTVAFCVGIAGYLGLLSSEGRDRIREWESQDPSHRNAPDTKALAAAGRRVGFASVIVALILPLVVPGLHMTRLFGGQAGIGGHGGAGVSGSGPGGVGFPGVDTQFSQQLSSELTTPAQIVLGYSTAVQSPDYLQLYVLDKLTDSGWSLFSQPKSTVRVDPRLPAPPGLDDASLDGAVTTTVTVARDVGPDDLNALPVPYPTTTVKAKGDLEADRSTLMVFDQGQPLGGLSYQVTSLVNAPSEQALGIAGQPPAVIKSHYLQVPNSYDPLRALAESVVRKAGAKTALEKAVALQDWLSGGSFKYTLKAPTVLDANGLSRFLKVTKSGYCQQFSFAMAVLARLLDIPSRIAYGFTSGSSLGDDEWQVTTHDAHAWPELYFSGFGWLRFEPTPSGPTGQGTAFAPAYADLAGGPSSGTFSPSAATSASGSPAGSSAGQAIARHRLSQQLGDEGGPNLGGVGNTFPTANAHGTNPWEVFGLVVAGLLILGLVAPYAARLAIRRRRWHRRRRLDRPDQADAEWAHAAWRELRDDLADYGAGCLPSESPRAVAARAGTELALAEPALAALGRIAMAEERARYAARPTDGSGLRHDSVTVRRAIAIAVPRPTRWRGRLLPASVIGPALNATAQAADIFGRLTPEWLSRFRTPAP
jgi:transglutaminase-like putative cysteine protease